MGKPKQKKRHKKPAPKVVQVGSNKFVRKGERVKPISCTLCPRTNQLLTMSQCTKCELHNDSYCLFTPEPYRIKTITVADPQKFNRLMIQNTSESIQDDSRNYYFTTEIMNPTKRILNKAYVALKRALYTGVFKDHKTGVEPRKVAVTKPLIYLITSREDVCFIHDGNTYGETDEFDIEGAWTVEYYLYDMYSYTGLGDLMVDGRSYRVLQEGIDGKDPDLFIVSRENKLLIGR